MKNLFVLLMIVFQLIYAIMACGQQMQIIDLNSSNVKKLGNARVQSIGQDDKRPIWLNSNEDGIEFEASDIDMISFRYSLPRINDNYQLVLEINTSSPCTMNSRLQGSNNQWKKLKEILISNTNRVDFIFLETFATNVGGLGTNTLRFKMLYPDGSGNGGVYIDSIVIHKLSQEQKSEIKNERDADCQRQHLIDEINRHTSCDSINRKYADIYEQYILNFEYLLTIKKNVQVIQYTQDLSKFLSNRSQMGNPVVYTEFLNLIDSITSQADTVNQALSRNYMSQLENVDKQYQNILDTSSNTPRLGNLLKVVSSLASVVTAGRVDNIINGVRQIVTTIYNSTTLSQRYPPFSQVLVRNRIENQKNQANENRIRIEQQKGIKYLSQLDSFANIARRENEIFLKEIFDVEFATSPAYELSVDIDELIISYLSDISIIIGKDELRGINNNPERLTDIRRDIKSHFDKARTDNPNSFFCMQLYVAFEKLDGNIKRAKQLRDRYRRLSDGLIDVYNNIQANLMADYNPFNRNEYPNSFSKYQGYKVESQKSLDNVIKHLADLIQLKSSNSLK